MKTKILIVFLVIIMTYIMMASMIFAVRHPWATQMETIKNIDKVLLFQKISYKETREKYEKQNP